MKIALIISLLAASLFAQEARYEKNKLFVKVKKGRHLPDFKINQIGKPPFWQKLPRHH